jgi:hypothetical protein
MSDFTRLDNIEAATQSIKQRIREFKLRYRLLYNPTVEETVEVELDTLEAEKKRFKSI